MELRDAISCWREVRVLSRKGLHPFFEIFHVLAVDVVSADEHQEAQIRTQSGEMDVIWVRVSDGMHATLTRHLGGQLVHSLFSAVHVHHGVPHREHMSRARHAQKASHAPTVARIAHGPELVARRGLRTAQHRIPTAREGGRPPLLGRACGPSGSG